MFRPIAGMTHLRIMNASQRLIHKFEPEVGRYWPKHVAIFFFFFTIINPYYHSCVFMTDINLTISKYEILQKFVRWECSWYLWTERQADMTRLIVGFHMRTR
jgi:hypothetical protein